MTEEQAIRTAATEMNNRSPRSTSSFEVLRTGSGPSATYSVVKYSYAGKFLGVVEPSEAGS